MGQPNHFPPHRENECVQKREGGGNSGGQESRPKCVKRRGRRKKKWGARLLNVVGDKFGAFPFDESRRDN